MTWAVEWAPRALHDLYRIPNWQTAALVDEAILRFAESGTGALRRVQTEGGIEHRLLVYPYFVRLTRDRASKTIYVWRIVRYA
jgi:hypothetical protein